MIYLLMIYYKSAAVSLVEKLFSGDGRTYASAFEGISLVGTDCMIAEIHRGYPSLWTDTASR